MSTCADQIHGLVSNHERTRQAAFAARIETVEPCTEDATHKLALVVTDLKPKLSGYDQGLGFLEHAHRDWLKDVRFEFETKMPWRIGYVSPILQVLLETKGLRLMKIDVAPAPDLK